VTPREQRLAELVAARERLDQQIRLLSLDVPPTLTIVPNTPRMPNPFGAPDTREVTARRRFELEIAYLVHSKRKAATA